MVELTKEQAIAEAQRRGLIPKPEVEDDNSEFLSGIARGAKTNASLVTEGVPAFLKGLGNKIQETAGFEPSFDNQSNLEQYQKEVEAAYKKYPTEFKSVQDVEGLGDVPGFIAGAAGESLPSLLTAGGAGFLGAKVSATALQNAAKRAGTKVTEDALTKALTRGAVIGATTASAPQNLSETYLNLLEKGENAPLTAVAIGTLKSALDIYTPTTVLGKLLGREAATDVISKSLLKRMGLEALKTGAQEGVTEAGQEGLDILAEKFVVDNAEIFSPENMWRVIDSGLKGTVGGAVAGGGTAPFMSTGDVAPKDYKPDPRNDAMFEPTILGSQTPAKTVKSAVDSSILYPVNLSDDLLSTAGSMGIELESLSAMTEEDLKSFQADLAPNPTTQTVQIDPLIVDKVSTRQKNARAKETKGPNVFVAGDGVINQGVQISDKPVRRSRRKVKTMDAEALARFERLQAMDNEQLIEENNRERAAKGLPPAKLQRSLPFNNWFGQSVLVDEEKNPIPMYHGTSSDTNFTQFKPTARGIFFHPNKEAASEYSESNDSQKLVYDNGRFTPKNTKSRVIPVYLKMENPYRLSEEEQQAYRKAENYRKFQQGIAEKAKRAGHDSVIYPDGGHVVFDPKQIKSVYNTDPDSTAKFQIAGKEFPSYGDIDSDYVVPQQIAENLKGVRLTPAAFKKAEDLIAAVKRIVREVGGSTAKVEAFNTLFDGTHSARGAQFLQTIAVAINDSTNPTLLQETAYHETFHFLWEMGAYIDKEKQILLNNRELLIDYAMQDSYLREQDLDAMLTNPADQEELIANAVGKIAVEYNKDPASLDKQPAMLRNAFRKMKRFMSKLSNAMRGLGFNDFDSIIESTIEGKRAIESVQDANNLVAQARLQRFSERVVDNHNMRQAEGFKKLAEDSKAQQNAKDRNTRKGMGLFARYVQSIVATASKEPMAAVVYDSVRRKMDNTALLLNKYVNLLGDFQSQKQDVRYRIHNLADRLNKAKTKSSLDEQGRLVYTLNGITYRLEDKEASTQYMKLQTAYAEVLSDWRNGLFNSANPLFKKLLPKDAPVNDIKAYEALLKTIDKDKSPELHKKLVNLIEANEALDNMSKYDFVPHMRFGATGIVVKNKQNETVAFYTIEKGSFRDLYNQFQLDETMSQIREKYSDKSKYTVIGGQGAITNLNSNTVVPFDMTYQNLKNHIDTRYLNIESIASLLYSKGVDQDAYMNMRDELYNDILSKGFEKRFNRDKSIDGYSKDWDRVTHAYLSGASHYLAAMPFQEELSVLTTEISKLSNNPLKKYLEDFLQYTNSPQEDFQAMRTMNFLWTMGGNLSTAMLQTVTLPTTTLGVMSQYNPNVFQNMKYIAKWTKIAATFFADAPKQIIMQDGTMAINFAEEAKLQELQKKGILSKEHAEFIQKISNYGKVNMTLSEESIGFKSFETRSLGGQVKERLSNLGRLLGAPISAMEQMTRFATTMASYDMLLSNPAAMNNMQKVLRNDYRFQAQLKTQADMNPIENAALFTMDEAHAVFGKLGRVQYQKGIGGALVFPFMTYPHQMLELMARLSGRGKDGYRGLGVMLGALFLISGLMGLPGAELLKEVLEFIENQITGSEEDYDLLIREKIYGITKDANFAKAVTQGIGRGYLGLDISRRVGLPIPGQEILLSLLGIRGDASSMLGVQGSLLTASGNAWKELNSEGGLGNVAAAMMPVAASNVVKAMNMTQEGVKTGKGVQTILPEEITAKTVIAKALGVTSDQIATGRESVYYRQLAERKFTVGMEQFRSKGKNIATEMFKARAEGDSDGYEAARKRYAEMLEDLREFAKKENYPVNFASFNKTVMQAAIQRTTGAINYKNVRKHARHSVQELQEILGK
jgi:hypothetical protein